MPTQRVESLLRQEGVEYARIEHRRAYTAQEEAEEAHVSGREWAKTVLVYADEKPALAVLPATHRADLDRLAHAAGAHNVRLASEDEIVRLFPDCEIGAVPPFGALWGVPVFCDESLRIREQVAFNAGRHDEAVRMRYADFERLVGPVVADFAERAAGPVDAA